MASPCIGIYEKALPDVADWRSRFAAAKEAGFDFVEIAVDETDERLARLRWSSDERREIVSAAKSEGIEIYNLILSAHRKFPFGSASVETRLKAMEIMEEGLRLAADLEIPVIQLSGYFVFYEDHHAACRDYFMEGLSRSANLAKTTGITLGVENMDGEDVVTLDQAKAIVDEISSPALRLYPDLGNLGGNGLDVCGELEGAAGYFASVHLKDAKPGVYRRVPFGEGVVPFADAFRTLKKIGYDGRFLIEMWNDGEGDAMSIIKNARSWILEQMAEADYCQGG